MLTDRSCHYKVFCTPSMASFLRGNQPWAQLVERRNISIREVLTWNEKAPVSARLTSLVSFLPVLVPHRAELSDTVAYLITASRCRASEDTLVPDPEPLAGTPNSASECDGGAGTGDTLRVFYCPDTDGWSGWEKDIREWCHEVDVALVDATFYDKHELKGRDMSEVWTGRPAMCFVTNTRPDAITMMKRATVMSYEKHAVKWRILGDEQCCPFLIVMQGARSSSLVGVSPGGAGNREGTGRLRHRGGAYALQPYEPDSL